MRCVFFLAAAVACFSPGASASLDDINGMFTQPGGFRLGADGSLAALQGGVNRATAADGTLLLTSPWGADSGRVVALEKDAEGRLRRISSAIEKSGSKTYLDAAELAGADFTSYTHCSTRASGKGGVRCRTIDHSFCRALGAAFRPSAEAPPLSFARIQAKLNECAAGVELLGRMNDMYKVLEKREVDALLAAEKRNLDSAGRHGAPFAAPPKSATAALVGRNQAPLLNTLDFMTAVLEAAADCDRVRLRKPGKPAKGLLLDSEAPARQEEPVE